MIFTVRGGGFGLYGYVPALLAREADSVVLPLSYRLPMTTRVELRSYVDRIRWVSTREGADALAEAVVVAIPPRAQQTAAIEAIRRDNVRSVVLEKPIAPSPAAAKSVLQAIRNAGKQVRVGYTFLFTDWYQTLASQARDRSDDIQVEWTFKAHHFANDLPLWKRRADDGGGVVRFYGIHLIALLAKLGYERVLESATSGAMADEPEKWRARFRGPGSRICDVLVDSRAAHGAFRIFAKNVPRPIVEFSSPFDRQDTVACQDDPRIPALRRLVTSLADDDLEWLRFYEAANDLWSQVEEVNESC